MPVRTRPDPSLARADRRTVALGAVSALVIALGGFSVSLLDAASQLWAVPTVTGVTVGLIILTAVSAADHLDQIRVARRVPAPPAAEVDDLLALADAVGVPAQFPARRTSTGRILGRHSAELAVTDTIALRVVTSGDAS